jgi:hypothetical protein
LGVGYGANYLTPQKKNIVTKPHDRRPRPTQGWRADDDDDEIQYISR